jgi:hypothetical protein
VNRPGGLTVVIVAALGALSSCSTAFAAAPLRAPATIGSYVTLAHTKKLQGATGQNLAKHTTAEDAQTTAMFSSAYGGRPAVVQTYGTQDLQHVFTLAAVRGHAPLPWVGYGDAKDIGLARPPLEARAVGDAWCRISNDETPYGKTPARDSVHVLFCLRSAANLTVELFNLGGDSDPAPIVAALDAAWKRIANGSEGGTVAHPPTPSHAKLPLKLGGLVDPSLDTRGTASDRAFSQKLSVWGVKTYLNVSRAFGGAPAVTRSYTATAKGDDSRISVVAVEAPAPSPIEPYEDAKRDGLLKPQNEVISVGDARCDIQNYPTLIGDTPKPDSVTVVRCQLTRGAHTVIALPGGAVAHDPKTVVAFAELAWAALGWN